MPKRFIKTARSATRWNSSRRFFLNEHLTNELKCFSNGLNSFLELNIFWSWSRCALSKRERNLILDFTFRNLYLSLIPHQMPIMFTSNLRFYFNKRHEKLLNLLYRSLAFAWVWWMSSFQSIKQWFNTH